MRDDLVALCRARSLGDPVRRAGRLGPPREPRLARRGPVPALPDAAATRPRRRACGACRSTRTTRSNTPRDLNTDNPVVEASLRGAISDVQGLGKGLNVTLREVQYEKRGDERIPIHGGPGDPEGDFNAINVDWVPGQGYPNVPHGSSFVMVSRLDGSKCGFARSILTYSQSTNAGVALLRRPDADVQPQGVEAHAVLREGHPRRPRPHDHPLRAREVHEPAGDHLPPAAAQARADQAAARDRQRQAREGQARGAQAACACRCAGGPRRATGSG